MMICNGITLKSKKCTRETKTCSFFCGYHAKTHRNRLIDTYFFESGKSYETAHQWVFYPQEYARTQLFHKTTLEIIMKQHAAKNIELLNLINSNNIINLSDSEHEDVRHSAEPTSLKFSESNHHILTTKKRISEDYVVMYLEEQLHVYKKARTN